jgi:hypothetical protein
VEEEVDAINVEIEGAAGDEQAIEDCQKRHTDAVSRRALLLIRQGELEEIIERLQAIEKARQGESHQPATEDDGAMAGASTNDRGDMFDDGDQEAQPNQVAEEEKEINEGAAWHKALEAKRMREAPGLTMAEFMSQGTGVKDNTWTGYQLAFRGWADFFSEWIRLTNEERGRQKPPMSRLPTCPDPSSASARSRKTEPSPDWRRYDITIQAAVRA